MSDREARFFKGGKSKAIKGAQRHLCKAGVEFTNEELGALLFQHGETGEWGFDPDTLEDAALKKQLAAKQPDSAPAPEGYPGGEEQREMDEQELGNIEPPPNPEPNPFGHMNHSLQTHQASAPAPQAQQRTSQRANYTIEKNRPEQNGIKRPSAGGKCREVWDAMDALRESLGSVPTSEQVRKMAEEKGWNKNNAMIEFYQWRKFNGITGRGEK